MLLKHKYMDNVTDSDGLIYFVKYTFSFGFSTGFEGNNKYAKKVLLCHGMRWPCSFHFRYVRNKIVFSLQVDFPMPEVASHADALRLVTRSSPWTSAERSDHFWWLAVSLCFERQLSVSFAMCFLIFAGQAKNASRMQGLCHW